MSIPEFDIVPPGEAAKRRPARRERRDWGAVLDALLAGRNLFMSEEHLSDANVKYLTLALARRGQKERLRTTRTERDGTLGRLIWIERVK